jgi:uncharacterized alpha/beta hydrolase family protein
MSIALSIQRGSSVVALAGWLRESIAVSTVNQATTSGPGKAGSTLRPFFSGQSAALDGAAQCWGLNDYGELDDGSTTDSHVPVQVQFP